MIETLAPKTAALETPKVLGEAMIFPKTVCMMSPEMDSPAPAINAAKASGRRIFCTMRIEDPFPTPNKARKDSPIPIFELPRSKQSKKERQSNAEKKIKAIHLFLLLGCESMFRLYANGKTRILSMKF